MAPGAKRRQEKEWGGFCTRLLGREVRQVLGVFGMRDAEIRFLQASENRVWRVQQGRQVYVLRCHRPPRLCIAALPALALPEIEAELDWLGLLSKEAAFPVPAPMVSGEGERVVTRGVGEAGVLHWTLLRWVPGRQYRRGIREAHLRAAGRMMAELHLISFRVADRRLPRPSWDARRLQQATQELEPFLDRGAIPRETWQLIERTGEDVAALGERVTGRSEWGMLHGDLNPNNVVFIGGRAAPIDFCSCGYGYYAYDIAQMLTLAPHERFWRAFLAGYEEVRVLGEEGRRNVRVLAGMSFVLWLNAHVPTELVRVQGRLPAVTERVRTVVES